MKCPYCEFINEEGQAFCTNCGSPLYPQSAPEGGIHQRQGNPVVPADQNYSQPGQWPYEQAGYPSYGQPPFGQAPVQPPTYGDMGQAGNPAGYGQFDQNPADHGQSDYFAPGYEESPSYWSYGQNQGTYYQQPYVTSPPVKKKWPIILAISLSAVVLVGAIIFFLFSRYSAARSLKKQISQLLPSTAASERQSSTAIKEEREEETTAAPSSTVSVRETKKTTVATAAAEEPTYAPPVFTSVQASSSRYYEGYGTYKPEFATDGDYDTSWVEGAEGTGEGEWIELRADHPQVVRKVRILGGYNKRQDLFDQNFQPATVTVSLSNGDNYTVLCPQGYRQWAELEIPPTETSFVKITIDMVYANELDDAFDTCITEIEVE